VVLGDWASKASLVLRTEQLDDRERRALRLVARKTWRFFEEFVVKDDHWLPPDNFQEDPAPVLARRTSPTNLGLYLLSAIAAHDFGWIGTHETVDRMAGFNVYEIDERGIARIEAAVHVPSTGAFVLESVPKYV